MRLTIDKKVSLFITTLIFVLGGVLGFYSVQTQSRTLSHETDEWGRHLLEDMITDLEYPLLVRDREAIARRVGVVIAEKDVVFCSIEGKDGAPIYQQGARPAGETREFAFPIVTGGGGGAAESLILGEPRERSETIGRAVLLLSMARLNQRIFEIKRTVAAVVSVAIVVASLGAYLLLKRLIGVPIGLLVQATERIAEGDLSYRVPRTMKDEFEIVGHSFNRMTESLRNAQEELLQREKLAMLGQLAGGVGNELRNPLGVMNNAVFLLKELLPDADETVSEYLEIIRNEIENSHRIISEFIDFFRTKAPQARPVPSWELISECLEGCVIPEDVTVATELPEALPPLMVDPAQITQVLRNLVANAVQAMPQGGALRIRGALVGAPGEEEAPPGRRFVEISIADTGTGIAPENLDRIFEPLFSTKSRGIGLGLPISRNLTEANGGRIRVESRLGEGTCFTLLLPAEGGSGANEIGNRPWAPPRTPLSEA